MRRSMQRFLIVIPAVVVLTLPFAAPAVAATTSCDLTDGVLNIVSDTTGYDNPIRLATTAQGAVRLEVGPGGEPSVVVCTGNPTVETTETIYISAEGLEPFLRFNLDNSGFVQADGDEIDIHLYLPFVPGPPALFVTANPAGSTLIAGGSGMDINGDGDRDMHWGGETPDVLVMMGNLGNDNLSLAGSPATAVAFPEPSTIRGGEGADILRGGSNVDRIVGGPGNDKMYGGDGDDFVGASSDMPDDLGWGNDLVDGGAGNDELGGGEDNDTLRGGLGNDTFTGGTGTDTATYSTATGPVTATLDGQRNDGQVALAEADLLHADVENIIGSPHADRLTGSTGTARTANRLTGGGDADVLSGLDGEDLLIGGLASDRLLGGTGHDQLRGDAGDDVLLAGAGYDFLYGHDGADDLRGETGPDVLYGAAGNDALNGGPNADECYGGTGRNTRANCEMY